MTSVHHALHGIQFEWDQQKAALNHHKHRVSFEKACEAFFDPFLCANDVETVEDEVREAVVGLTEN